MKKGYVHVYTGSGKGKTTAALGLGIRAAGAGMKVHMVQFMKGRRYSEINGNCSAYLGMDGLRRIEERL